MWNRSENKINCIFIRHGCTVSNREHRYLGRTDEPLDEAGVFELKNALNNGVYKALEENRLKEQIIITSPMRRCKQTAEIILPVAQHHKIHTVKEFAEMDFGEWELKAIRSLAQISVSGTHIRRGLIVVEHLPFQTERAEKSFAKEVYVALRGYSHRH